MIKKCEKHSEKICDVNIGCFFVPLNEKGVKMKILICDRKSEFFLDKVCVMSKYLNIGFFCDSERDKRWDVRIYKRYMKRVCDVHIYRLFFVTLNEIGGKSTWEKLAISCTHSASLISVNSNFWREFRTKINNISQYLA